MPAALTWAALAVALLLAPVARPAQSRARALARRGRLFTPAAPIASRLRLPRVSWLGLCAVVAVLVGVCCGVALGLAALVAAATGVSLALAGAERRRRDRAAGELLAAVTLMAAELEAGASAATALTAAAELSKTHAEVLRAAAARLAAGDDATQVAADGDLAGLAHAWRLAATNGAPLAEVCTRVARDLAARAEQRRAVAGALAGARSSAALLAGLPVVGVLLGTAMQARPVQVLFTTPAGHGVLLAGVCLDAAGLAWTHWLAARAEGP